MSVHFGNRFSFKTMVLKFLKWYFFNDRLNISRTITEKWIVFRIKTKIWRKNCIIVYHVNIDNTYILVFHFETENDCFFKRQPLKTTVLKFTRTTLIKSDRFEISEKFQQIFEKSAHPYIYTPAFPCIYTPAYPYILSPAYPYIYIPTNRFCKPAFQI